MNNNNPDTAFLSIIIPHYNTPLLLEKLLDSIPLTEPIDVIVVDDKSTMHLDEKDRVFSEKRFSRFKFMNNHSEKKGPGTCRNIGLEHARGKWVLFADADDFFLENFYHHVSSYFDSDADVVFFIPTSIYIDTGKTADRHILHQNLLDNYLSSPSLENELGVRYKMLSPCSKMIKTSLIKKYSIRFDEVVGFEDVMFSTKVGHFLNKFVISNQKIYCVTRRRGSIMSNQSELFFDRQIQVHLEQYRYLQKELDAETFDKLKLRFSMWVLQANKYGIRKTYSLYRLLQKNNIKVFRMNLLNTHYIIFNILKSMYFSFRNKKYFVK